jgi:hypothetical protein
MFHIWPHASQRQYVEASTFSLGVEIFADWQKGQALGVTGAASPGTSSCNRDTNYLVGTKDVRARCGADAGGLSAGERLLPLYMIDGSTAVDRRTSQRIA